MTDNKLQNLKQGSRSLEEYAEEFSLLLIRTEIYDSEEQLVSRFIGGLQPQLQNSLAPFDPATITEAHHRVVSFEQHSRSLSSTWSSPAARTRPGDSNSSLALAKTKDNDTELLQHDNKQLRTISNCVNQIAFQ